MSNNQQLALSIQPIISYPRQAQVGKTYLMTIDLQSSSDEWPYEEEEYPIYCILDTSQLFSCQPLGEPAVVLHRFGGSYGAAEFLLTAAQEKMQGEITVTLANAWGMPIRVLSLGKISVTQVVTKNEETVVTYKRTIDEDQKLERNSDIRFRRNPYIIGRPIHEREKFFGRESLFHFIEDNLSQGTKVILLYGQRRIGKSSVLQQIPNFIQSNEFIFVQFDLQDKTYSSLSNIIHDLAIAIIEQIDMDMDMDNLQIQLNAQLEKDINSFSEIFLPIVYEKIGHKKIVLLLDQFDFVNNDNNDIDIDKQHIFFPYLKKVLKDHDRLFIIPVIERYLNDWPSLLNLFKYVPIQEIGLLDEISAKRMITRPAEGILTYQPEAIKEILQLSAGHPCFTQVICSVLFEQARENNKWIIERGDVEGYILYRAIEKADSFFQSFWQLLTNEERIIMSTVAETQKIAIEEARIVPKEPFDLLSRNGINRMEQLSEAWERLIEKGYLSDNGRKFKVELIRHWVLQYHPLQNQIEIFKINNSQTELQIQNEQEDIVKNLIGVANYWRQQGQNQLVLELYEQAFAIKPNDFNIVVSLAEQYLQAKDFEKSLELYEQLLQADYQSFKEGYCNALSEYGHYLIIQGEYALAKEKYHNILEIEPNTRSAIQKILEIETHEQKSVIANEVSSNQGWVSKAMAFIRRIIER
jgi:tetratricopeptide (TPR) repeat protein